MGDLNAFLAGIRDGDAVGLLVLADWFQERGDGLTAVQLRSGLFPASGSGDGYGSGSGYGYGSGSGYGYGYGYGDGSGDGSGDG